MHCGLPIYQHGRDYISWPNVLHPMRTSWLRAVTLYTVDGGVARGCRDNAASVLAMWLSLNEVCKAEADFASQAWLRYQDLGIDSLSLYF